MIDAIIDLSHWQVTPDFAALKSSGIAAVILKATQGSSWIDSTFVARVSLAHAAGLLVGAYHFCDATSPAIQTTHFLTVAMTATPVLALDIEANGMGETVSIAQAAEMASRIQTATDRLPLIYMNRYGPDGRGTGLPNSVLSRCPLWIAEYTNSAQPKLPPDWLSWTIWQHTDVPYDKDRFNGTLAELEAFWR
jgi:lysozyme